MSISQLFVYQFRNLQSQTLIPHPKLNVFFGHNGQGKTNLLEAIALGLSLRPLRSLQQTSDLIQQGQVESAIHLNLDLPSQNRIALAIHPNGKKAKINDKPIKDASTLLSKAALVTFVPDDLQIVLGSSTYRRRFLDQLVVGLFPASVRTYRSYERTLLSRNQVLKSYPIDQSQLHAFTQLLIQSGAFILWYRLQAVAKWLPWFTQATQSICGFSKPILLQYHPVDRYEQDTQALETWWMERWNTLYAEEYKRKTTLFGPHLEDITLLFDNGLSVRQAASRGQARALTLAMKIAQLQTLCQARQYPPVLLLDDVAGELDPKRAHCLFELIHSLGIQTFLTTTHQDTLPIRLPDAFYGEMRDGLLA